MLVGEARREIDSERLGVPGHGRRRLVVQRRRVPSVHVAARHVLVALFRAQLVARRVAGAAVDERLGEIRAAVPLRALRRIGLEGAAIEVLVLPERHREARHEHRVGGRRVAHGLARHDEGVERLEILVPEAREVLVGKHRIVMVSFGVEAFAHRPLEIRHAPAADARFRIGRDVAGVHSAEGRLQRKTARIGFAAGRRMAGHAIAHRGEERALRDEGSVERARGHFRGRDGGRRRACHDERRSHESRSTRDRGQGGHRHGNRLRLRQSRPGKDSHVGNSFRIPARNYCPTANRPHLTRRTPWHTSCVYRGFSPTSPILEKS